MRVSRSVFYLYDNMKENSEQKCKLLTDTERRTVLAVFKGFQEEKKSKKDIIVDKGQMDSILEKCKKFDSAKVRNKSNFINKIETIFFSILDFFNLRISPARVAKEVEKIVAAKRDLNEIKFKVEEKEKEKQLALEGIEFNNTKVQPHQMIEEFHDLFFELFPGFETTDLQPLKDFLNEQINGLDNILQNEEDRLQGLDNPKEQKYLSSLKTKVLMPLIDMRKKLEEESLGNFEQVGVHVNLLMLKIDSKEEFEANLEKEADSIRSLDAEIKKLNLQREELEKKALSEL